MDLDKETQQLSLRAEKFKALTSHPHWGEAKQELLNQLIDMNAVSGLDLTLPPEKVVEKIQIVRELTRIVYNWIGTLETAGSFTSKQDERDEYIVKRD
jgi:hypothetical protein